MKTRDELLQDRMKNLLSCLKTAGFKPVLRNRYNQDDEEVGHYLDIVSVLNSADQLIGKVRMSTGSGGYYVRFGGWKLIAPCYKPRGEYHSRQHEINPLDDYHWGHGVIKSEGGIAAKLMTVKLPGAREVAIGKLVEKKRDVMRDVTATRNARRHAFEYSDAQDELVELLEGIDLGDGKVSKEIEKIKRNRETYERLMAKLKKLNAKLDKLEGEDE